MRQADGRLDRRYRMENFENVKSTSFWLPAKLSVCVQRNGARSVLPAKRTEKVTQTEHTFCMTMYYNTGTQWLGNGQSGERMQQRRIIVRRRLC